MSELFSDSELGINRQQEETAVDESAQSEATTEQSQNTEETSASTEATTQTETTEETPWEFNPSKFNETVGTEFGSLDDVKSFIETANTTSKGYAELQEKYKQINLADTEKELKLKAIVDKINTKSLYANENISKLDAIVRQYPDKDQSILLRILDENKMSNISDLDAAIMQKQFEYGSSLTESSAKSLIRKELGVEDMSDLSSEDTALLQAMAIKAKNEFKKIQQVEATNVADLDSLFAEAKATEETLLKKRAEQWKPAMEAINQINDIKIPIKDFEGKEVEFPFSFNDGSKALDNSGLQNLVNGGIEPNEATVKLVNEIKTWEATYKNLPKIINTAVHQELTKAKKVWMAEVNNDASFNTQNRTGASMEDEIKRASAELSKNLGTKGSNLFG